jgi:hypothetical protein
MPAGSHSLSTAISLLERHLRLEQLDASDRNIVQVVSASP